MPTHGVPVVSVLIQNETQSKVFRIGDTMTDVTEDMPGSQPFTGVLRGIQLSARENKLNRGDKVYDNIPTVGYWNAGCGMADVTAEDYDIELLLLESAEGEVRIIHADMLKYLELYDEDQEAWISATKEEITTYINSISNDGITSIVVDDANNTVTVAIDTTNDLDIGLVPFLSGVDGLKSVVYTAGNQSYTLIVGDESTYTTFQKGVLNTMPNTNGSSTNGNLNLTAENGASLVYTLKVTYFNQDEEFQKIDTYLTGYQHTDVTVANTGDKAYTVVGHVVDAEGLNFDPLSAVAEVQNLTKVKITAGEQSQETSEIPAGIEGLKTFLNSVIPYDNTADPVTVAIELTAGNAIVTYTLVYSSDVIADPEAIVNGRRYATLAEALAGAQPGETIELQKDLLLGNGTATGAANNPVIALPANVSFDGGSHIITANEMSWSGTNMNHLIGVTSGTAAIKNVTLVGHSKMKSGIVCYGNGTNVTLQNITAQNCGNCGVQVAGATVSATNLTTSGNAWGGVNVDKGSDGSVPHFTFNSGTLAENVEIYTEITDQDVITASGFEKFQGFGTTLKGFMYYTSDVATKFAGAIVIDDKIYETIADAIENNDAVTVTVPASKAESFSIPEGKTVTLDMGGNTLSNVDGSDTIVNNGTLIINGEGTIDNTSNDKAAITNNGTLTILKGTITRSTDAGTADGDGGNSYYTILNHGTMIIGAEEGNDADVVISNNGAFSSLISNGWYDSEGKTPEADSCYMTINCGTFTGGKYCFKNDELGNATINGGVYSGAANVSVLNWHNMTINNCVFTAAAAKANVANGTYGQGVGHLVITGGEFNATNVPNLTMINGYASSDIAVSGGVFTSKTGLSNYLVDGYRIDSEINPGKFTVVKVTPEEQLDEIMANIPGANEESDNVFAFTTTDGTISLDFLDQIAAINGFSDMKVSDGQTEYTFTNDGVMATFKEQIQTLLPASNEDPQVTLTLTVNFAV